MPKMDESLEFMPRIMWSWIKQIFVLTFFQIPICPCSSHFHCH